MKSGTIRYVGYMWVVHCEDVGIMLILPPETSHILSVLPLHNSTELGPSDSEILDCLEVLRTKNWKMLTNFALS